MGSHVPAWLIAQHFLQPFFITTFLTVFLTTAFFAAFFATGMALLPPFYICNVCLKKNRVNVFFNAALISLSANRNFSLAQYLSDWPSHVRSSFRL